jgi:hypothetical protein
MYRLSDDLTFYQFGAEALVFCMLYFLEQQAQHFEVEACEFSGLTRYGGKSLLIAFQKFQKFIQAQNLVIVPSFQKVRSSYRDTFRKCRRKFC